MTIATLRSALPDWAKDLSLNLSTLSRSSSLTEQQQWGTFVAAAAATRNESVLVQVMEDARTHLSEEAIGAALGAASIMAMNNVAYRTRHFLGSAYDNERMGLRMNIIGTSGDVEKVDFELWILAVSTINGCEHCAVAHDKTVREEGLTKEQVWEAIKVAATSTEAAQKAIDWIRGIVAEPEIGAIYNGKVVKTADFGAFVNFLGARDGLVHISKLGGGKRVEKVEDVVNVGDKIEVEILDIDNRGKISLGLSGDSI